MLRGGSNGEASCSSRVENKPRRRHWNVAVRPRKRSAAGNECSQNKIVLGKNERFSRRCSRRMPAGQSIRLGHRGHWRNRSAVSADARRLRPARRLLGVLGCRARVNAHPTNRTVLRRFIDLFPVEQIVAASRLHLTSAEHDGSGKQRHDDEAASERRDEGPNHKSKGKAVTCGMPNPFKHKSTAAGRSSFPDFYRFRPPVPSLPGFPARSSNQRVREA